MAAITYLVSMALMALFLLAILGVVVAGRDWRTYTPRLTPAGGGGSRLSAAAGSETVWVVVFLTGIAVVGGGATLFASGEFPARLASAGGIAAGAVLALAFVFYVFYGSYRAAKARGFQKAAAVMAGAWILGLLLIALIAVNLLA